MGFWVFMFCMALLIPVCMIVFGNFFKNYQPAQKINISGYMRKSDVKRHIEWKYLSGYRTRRSMQNDQTYAFAQKLFGAISLKLGAIMLLPSILTMFFVIGKNKDTVGTTGGVVVFIQCLVMIAVIFPVESALKEHFDEDGRRIK